MAGKRQLKPSVVSAARPAEGAVANGDAKPPALPPGLLASYRAEELIGAGAMGVVWRATHLGLQRPAAIKLPTLTDPSYVERFVREGRLLSRLRHPNLVRVYDAGAVDGCPYLVMEFVRGCTLAGLARGRALPPEVAVALVSQLLEGLGHAHAGGVLHRDVKSDNALVTREGVVKLADFGLARADFEPGRTQVGMLMGTPAYMSPEQAGGVALDARSDLYSVAVVLFELVAGRLPFVSDNPLELLRRQMKEAPPMLAQVASGVPQELADAVMRGLAKDPAERFGSAGEFAAALRETVSEQRLERAMARLPGLVASAGASAQVVAGTTAASPAVVTRRAPGREAPDRTVAASPARKREDGRATARPGSDEPRRWRGRALTFFALVLAAAFWAGSRAPRPVTPAAPDVPAIQSRPAGARTTQAAPPPKLEFLRKNSVGYEEYRNEKDGSELISIPKGTFAMGANDIGTGEKPVRQVTLSAYYIGKYEVTWGKYGVFCRKAQHRTPRVPLFRVRDNDPVVNVSWDDAKAYCDWVDLRLPTEAEWEFAARGTQGRKYPWGEDPPDARRARYGKIIEGTSPVGTHPLGASPFGAMDMAGNAWEWGQDWVGPTYATPVTDPRGPETGTLRFLRGGSWCNEVNTLRTAFRNTKPPSETSYGNGLGFRVAR